MRTYYVFSPRLPETALVEAPSAEKAKTEFLDYLARTGKVPYRQRGSVRWDLKAVKSEPGEFQPTVELSYYGESAESEQVLASDFSKMKGYPTPEDVETSRPVPGEGTVIPRAVPKAVSRPEPVVAKVEPIQVESTPVEPRSTGFKSPLMDLSRRSGGL